MEKKTVEATVPEKKDKDGKVIQRKIGPYAIQVDFPGTVEEAKGWASDEALLTNAFANWRVTLQSNMRSGMIKGETQEQLQQRLGKAKMGVSQKGVTIDPVQAYLARFENANPEEQKKMLQELQKRAAAGK